MSECEARKIWFGRNESPPGPGMVLVLKYHHEGESHWCSPEQAITRIEDIIDGCKPEEEWGPRMEEMKIVLYGKWWESNARYDAWAVYSKACSDAWAVYSKACSDAWAVYSKARSDAWAVYDKASCDAWAVYSKAWSDAGSVYSKARSDAWAVYSKVCSDAGSVYAKACSDAWVAYDKAWSDAGSVFFTVCSDLWGEEYPAEAWAAELSLASRGESP